MSTELPFLSSQACFTHQRLCAKLDFRQTCPSYPRYSEYSDPCSLEHFKLTLTCTHTGFGLTNPWHRTSQKETNLSGLLSFELTCLGCHRSLIQTSLRASLNFKLTRLSETVGFKLIYSLLIVVFKLTGPCFLKDFILINPCGSGYFELICLGRGLSIVILFQLYCLYIKYPHRLLKVKCTIGSYLFKRQYSKHPNCGLFVNVGQTYSEELFQCTTERYSYRNEEYSRQTYPSGSYRPSLTCPSESSKPQPLYLCLKRQPELRHHGYRPDLNFLFPLMEINVMQISPFVSKCEFLHLFL